MKITKNQLRRIIKEEKTRLLEEYEYDPLDSLRSFALDVEKGKTLYTTMDRELAVKEAVGEALYGVEQLALRLELDVPFKQLALEAIKEI